MINWCNSIHTPSGFLCDQWDPYFMVVQGLSYEQTWNRTILWVRIRDLPVLSLIQFRFTLFFFFSFCIVHNKYLETDVSTNQKVFIKYSVG